MRNIIRVLRRLGEAIVFPLCKLNEIQFSAPWDPTPPRCR